LAAPLSFIVRASMRHARPTLALLVALALLSAAGCSSSSSSDGTSDAKLVAALDLTMKGGHYVIDKNPFCSIEKLLHDQGEVSDAAKSGLVLASKNQTVGIQVIAPFAPACKREAERNLQKLAKKAN
jgi:hypothetical protein